MKWNDCPSSNNIEQSIFCDTLNTYELDQVNAISSTKHGNILDLVIANTPHLFSNIEECDTSFMSDHVAPSFSVYERFEYTRATARLMYNYKHTNVNGLINDLINSKLVSTVQLATSVDDARQCRSILLMMLLTNIFLNVLQKITGPACVDSELRQLQT